MKRLLIASLVLAAVVAPAHAHTPYPAPASFDVGPDSVVTLDASFAETFFVPEVVFDNSTFVVTDPDGTRHAPDTVHYLKTRAVAEQTLPGRKGTYRFSTGNRLGRCSAPGNSMAGPKAVAIRPGRCRPAPGSSRITRAFRVRRSISPQGRPPVPR